MKTNVAGLESQGYFHVRHSIGLTSNVQVHRAHLRPRFPGRAKWTEKSPQDRSTNVLLDSLNLAESKVGHAWIIQKSCSGHLLYASATVLSSYIVSLQTTLLSHILLRYGVEY